MQRQQRRLCRLLRRCGQGFWGGRAWIAPPALDADDRNARRLYSEVFWASVLTVAITFNAPFALRLGATNTEISLLTSMPALLALIITIPAGRIHARGGRSIPLLVGSLGLYRIGFLVVACLPFLPLAGAGTVLVWLLVGFTAPAHFFNVGWNSILADVVPETSRARVFATRNIIIALTTTGGLYVAGHWLERGPFPVSYQAMYLVAFAASMLSVYQISRLDVSEHRSSHHEVVRSVRQRTPPSLLLMWRRMRQAFKDQPDFVRIVVNTLLHGVGLWMVAPLYVLYFMRVLGATEGWLGLKGMFDSLAPAIGYVLWQRAVVRWGENRVLKWSISVIGIYPVLVGLTDSLTVILGWSALNGLIASGVILSHFPMLLKVCPADERPVYMGIYMMIMNAGAFVMPLLGVFLANRFGIAPILVAGGVLCIAGSSLFRFAPLRTEDSLQARQR